MRKFVILTIILLYSLLGHTQVQTIYQVSDINALKAYYGTSTRLYVASKNEDYVLCRTCIVNDSTVFKGIGYRIWLRLISDSSIGDRIIPAGPITSVATIGYDPGSNIHVSEFIINTFYQSQPPTIVLTGGQNLEYRSSQTMNYTLNWTAGRQTATDSIATIVVAGSTKTFTQPAQSSTVSGTQSVSFPANINITYTGTVTTTDNKTASATTTFSFLPKRYFGWISDTTGIGTTGFDDSKITALTGELSASKSKSWLTGSPTGVQFYVYAYYYTAGDLTQWDMNGFPSISAMNKATRSFTNALGYTGTWIIYWSKNGQTLSSTIVAN